MLQNMLWTRKYVKIHEQLNTDLFEFNSTKIKSVK